MPEIRVKSQRDLGHQLRYLIVNVRGYELRDFAAKSGVAYSALCRILAGKEAPQFATLLALVATLNVSIVIEPREQQTIQKES